MKKTVKGIRLKGSSIKKRNARTFYMIMTPFLIVFLLARIFPMVWGIFMSFTNYSGFNLSTLKMVGWDNYKRVVLDTEAFSSLGRTCLIGLVVIPTTLIMSNFMAALLAMKYKFVGIFRTLYYIPSILPAVAIGTMWSGMYLRDGGVFNELLKMFGQEPIHWLDYDHAFGSLVLMMVWSGGGSVLNIIAAIKNISPELYEAASIDGATPLQQYRHITLPLITPMNYMALVNGLIAALQIFGEPILLSGTSLTTVPIQPIYTYMVHTYQQIFVYLRFGYGLALTWIVFAIIMTATIINDKLSKRWVHTE